jgi:hypothetical protein
MSTDMKCTNCGEESKYVSSHEGHVFCDKPECEIEYRRYLKKIKEEEFEHLRQDNQCRFEKVYRGYCKEPGYPFCEEHKHTRCITCGEQATTECDKSHQLVCGAPLCDTCEHIHDYKMI